MFGPIGELGIARRPPSLGRVARTATARCGAKLRSIFDTDLGAREWNVFSGALPAALIADALVEDLPRPYAAEAFTGEGPVLFPTYALALSVSGSGFSMDAEVSNSNCS